MSIRLFGSAALIALASATLSVPVNAKELKKSASAKPAMVKATSAGKVTAKPVFGTFGMDTDGMNKAVKPGDDFFAFANGTWAAKTEIPADKASHGGFGILRDLSDTRTRAIIESVAAANNAPGSSGQKVGDYFASFMDEAAIEAKGAAPLAPLLAQVAAIQTPSLPPHSGLPTA
jgi:putative endopeptidase